MLVARQNYPVTDRPVIVPFEMRHALWIVNTNIDGRTAQDRLHIEAAAKLQGHGYGFTAIYLGHPIGAAGIIETQEGIGQVWAYLGHMSPWAVWFVRKCRLILDDCTALMKLRRVEARVLMEFKESIRWLELLGFENETPNGMKNYGPNGEMFILMSRVK